ncbi:hypothetical protein P7C70_g8465, partial [Phenoliferia sp. Uapishka_3]
MADSEPHCTTSFHHSRLTFDINNIRDLHSYQLALVQYHPDAEESHIDKAYKEFTRRREKQRDEVGVWEDQLAASRVPLKRVKAESPPLPPQKPSVHFGVQVVPESFEREVQTDPAPQVDFATNTTMEVSTCDGDEDLDGVEIIAQGQRERTFTPPRPPPRLQPALQTAESRSNTPPARLEQLELRDAPHPTAPVSAEPVRYAAPSFPNLRLPPRPSGVTANSSTLAGDVRSRSISSTLPRRPDSEFLLSRHNSRPDSEFLLSRHNNRSSSFTNLPTTSHRQTSLPAAQTRLPSRSPTSASPQSSPVVDRSRVPSGSASNAALFSGQGDRWDAIKGPVVPQDGSRSRTPPRPFAVSPTTQLPARLPTSESSIIPTPFSSYDTVPRTRTPSATTLEDPHHSRAPSPEPLPAPIPIHFASLPSSRSPSSPSTVSTAAQICTPTPSKIDHAPVALTNKFHILMLGNLSSVTPTPSLDLIRLFLSHRSLNSPPPPLPLAITFGKGAKNYALVGYKSQDDVKAAIKMAHKRMMPGLGESAQVTATVHLGNHQFKASEISRKVLDVWLDKGVLVELTEWDYEGKKYIVELNRLRGEERGKAEEGGTAFLNRIEPAKDNGQSKTSGHVQGEGKANGHANGDANGNGNGHGNKNGNGNVSSSGNGNGQGKGKGKAQEKEGSKGKALLERVQPGP